LQPKLDLRVTVVGDEVFGYKILVKGQPARGDWRLNARSAISYEKFDLDQDTADHCRALCRRLDLPFGAIDLAMTGDGISFIEINPTGEWAWLPGAPETAGTGIAEWLAAA
jgi:glutathione synthase/RimK-type ligase-like ATP-grasp enzyme